MDDEVVTSRSSSESEPLLAKPEVYNNGHRLTNYRSGFVRLEHPPANVVLELPNLVAVALQTCEKKVLRPYNILLTVVGWRPFFENADNRLKRFADFAYPLFIVLLVVCSYVMQLATCFQSTVFFPFENVTTTGAALSTAFAKLCPNTFTLYIIPDILHLCAYFFSFYVFRRLRSEQLPRLMEKVFLQTSSTHNEGYLSQRKLIKVLRALLLSGFIWLLLSIMTQVLLVFAVKNCITSKWLQWPNEETKITILILMLIGFIALDLVYIAVVINYCVQCGLLIFYIEGLQLKIREGILTIMQAMKEIAEINEHLQHLNYNLAIALSIVIFNFASLVILGMRVLLMWGVKDPVFSPHWADVCALIAMLLSVILYAVILFTPIIQAARLSAACNNLRKTGHEVRLKPFAYTNVSDQQLDSYLLYTSTLQMRAKLCLVPVHTSNLCWFGVGFSFFLLLFLQLAQFSWF